MFFWNSLAFSMIHWRLAIWSLIPLPFLNPTWTFGSSSFTCCWSLTWRILSIILLACKMSVWNRELMISDFLGPVTEIFVFALSLVSWIPRIISMSCPFPWSQLEAGSSQLWFRLCSRSFPIIVHLPDSIRDTCLFQHHYEWNPLFFFFFFLTLYSLLGIGFAAHQI